MNCEKCGREDPPLIIIIPASLADGKIDSLVCLNCAKESEKFCEKHDRAHTGFMDGTTACLWCVHNLVKANARRADAIKNDLERQLPDFQIEELTEAAEIASEITATSEAVSILRFIASKALRNNLTIDEVIERMVSGDGVKYILWG